MPPDRSLAPVPRRTYLEKLLHAHEGKSNKFAKADFRSGADFVITHYAGKVPYTGKDWLTKNRDPLNDNVVELLRNAGEPFIAELWSDAYGQAVSMNTSRVRKGAFRTVGHIYKEQLGNLITTLQSTQPNFVRCIIPNHQKKAGKQPDK